MPDPSPLPAPAPASASPLDRIEALVLQMGDTLAALDADAYRVQVQRLLAEMGTLRSALDGKDLAVERARLRALAARLQSQRDALGRQAALVDRSLEILLPGRTGARQTR